MTNPEWRFYLFSVALVKVTETVTHASNQSVHHSTGTRKQLNAAAWKGRVLAMASRFGPLLELRTTDLDMHGVEAVI